MKLLPARGSLCAAPGEQHVYDREPELRRLQLGRPVHLINAEAAEIAKI
jgi:hypothetical protein